MAFSRLPYNFEEALAEVKSWRASYRPDYNTEAVLVEEMQRMAKRIEEIEAELKAQPRTWVGLTDVEWMNIVNKDQAWFGQSPDEVAHEVAKLVEAKLKEKNT